MPTRAPMFQRPFSILNRIDIPATAGDRSAWIEEWQLSVSSTGSISLQRSDEYAIYLPGCSFQYPQPDRYPCNAVHKAWPCPRPLHFQYPQPDRYPCNAVHKAWPCPRPLHFQYPQPDRYPCNCLLKEDLLGGFYLSVSSTGSISLQPGRQKSCSSRSTETFQYPQPDRYPCNSE